MKTKRIIALVSAVLLGLTIWTFVNSVRNTYGAYAAASEACGKTNVWALREDPPFLDVVEVGSEKQGQDIQMNLQHILQYTCSRNDAKRAARYSNILDTTSFIGLGAPFWVPIVAPLVLIWWVLQEISNKLQPKKSVKTPKRKV